MATKSRGRRINFLPTACTTTLLVAACTSQSALAFLLPFQGSRFTAPTSKAIVPAARFQSCVSTYGLSGLLSSTDVRMDIRSRSRGSTTMMSTKNNNQMSAESYTEKAWDVITRLPQLATRLECQFIDNEILLKSLLEEGPQALANRVFFKAGVKLSQLETELDNYIASQPKVPDASNKVR